MIMWTFWPIISYHGTMFVLKWWYSVRRHQRPCSQFSDCPGLVLWALGCFVNTPLATTITRSQYYAPLWSNLEIMLRIAIYCHHRYLNLTLFCRKNGITLSYKPYRKCIYLLRGDWKLFWMPMIFPHRIRHDNVFFNVFPYSCSTLYLHDTASEMSISVL